MYRFVSAILTCAILAALPVSAGAAQDSTAKTVVEDRDPLSIRKLEWIAMLRGREFARLTRLLDAAQQKYESGQISSYEMRNLYSKFAYADMALLKHFNAWVDANAVDAPPLIARGFFLTQIGFTVRNSVVGPTPAPASQTMNKLFTQAVLDLHGAIRINKKSVAAHQEHMRILIDFNPHLFIKSAYDAALKSVPEAGGIQLAYAISLYPDWRDARTQEEKNRNVQEYADFLHKAERLRETEPDYRSVVRFAKSRMAQQARSKGDSSTAERLYSEIIAEKDSTLYRLQRAELRTSLNKFEEADDDIQKVMELDPDFVPLYAAASDLEQERKNFSAADKYIETALSLNPFDPGLLRKRAARFMKEGKNGAAVKTLEKALVLGNWSGKIHHLLGLTYHNIRNRKKEREHLQKAFVLRPWDNIVMGNLMSSLIDVKDCMFFDLAPSYAERCSKSKRCQQDGIFEVIKYNLKSMGLEKICRRTAPWNEKPKPNSF